MTCTFYKTCDSFDNFNKDCFASGDNCKKYDLLLSPPYHSDFNENEFDRQVSWGDSGLLRLIDQIVAPTMSTEIKRLGQSRGGNQ